MVLLEHRGDLLSGRNGDKQCLTVVEFRTWFLLPFEATQGSLYIQLSSLQRSSYWRLWVQFKTCTGFHLGIQPPPPSWWEYLQGSNLGRFRVHLICFLFQIFLVCWCTISGNSGFECFACLFSLLCVHAGQKEIWFLSVHLGHKQESNSILNSSSQWNYLANETLALRAFNFAYFAHQCAWQEVTRWEAMQLNVEYNHSHAAMVSGRTASC